MSPIAQRIAIAKRLGFKPDGPADKPESIIGWQLNGVYWSVLPDYLGSLDAMRRAELTLAHYEIGAYQDWVRKLVPNPPEHVGGFFALIHTAATYRAEAFLRTLGLWVES